jgi:glycosyltransferase involved in cell wall biosynthesis
VQALAMGLALVVSNIGGFTDLVNEGQNGYLIENKNDYEHVLRNLLDNPQTLCRFKAESRKKAEEFSITRVLARYETLLSACLTQKKETK